MVVHPAPGHYTYTMVNALLYHCGDSLSGINGVLRPGIVHRIDMDTSGVIMAAKNNNAHRSLALQLAEHTITRKYNAIVYNNIKEDEGTVDRPLGRNPQDRKKMAVVQSGEQEKGNQGHQSVHQAGPTTSTSAGPMTRRARPTSALVLSKTVILALMLR